MEPVGKNGFCGSWQEARDILRKWREQNVRKSAQTVEIGAYLLQHRASRLGDEGKVCSYWKYISAQLGPFVQYGRSMSKCV